MLDHPWAEPMHLAETQLRRSIDQTNLNPNASQAEISAFVDEAKAQGFGAVAIMLSWIPLATEILGGSHTTVVGPIGFPLGTCTTAAKVAETGWAIAHGPRSLEIDMVMNLSQLKSGRHDLVEKDICAVEQAAEGHILKVIIEAPLLTTQEIVIASLIAEAAGADYVKTSTGYKHFRSWRPSTLEDVRLIRGAVGEHLKIKVAGGVSTLSQAAAFLQAGASRIGTSAGVEILRQYREFVTIQA